MNIALIAHDTKKELMVQFCIAYCSVLAQHSLTATGTTGKDVYKRQSYVIATTDTEEYILSLAEKLDADMNQMMTNNPSASIATAAVITALGYLDELKKSTSGADNMRAQIKDYLEDAAKAKLSAEEARREVERLRREIGYLKENH